MIEVRLDVKEFEAMEKTLRALGTKAMPSVARTVINNLAFEVKQNTLIATARQEFNVRTPGMFKKFSKVDKATGNDIRSMHADVGMLDKGPGRTFDKQEEGGSYEHEYVPADLARVGGARGRKIAKKYLLSNGKIIDRSKAKNKIVGHSKLIPDLAMAKKLGLWVFHRGAIFEVTYFKRGKQGVRPKTKLKMLYAKPSKDVKVPGVGFMEASALRAMKKAGRFYKKAALTYIKRNIALR